MNTSVSFANVRQKQRPWKSLLGLAAMLLLGLSQPAQAQLACDTGYAYMLMSNNATTPVTTALRRLNLSTGTWTNVVASTPYSDPSNALGLTADGSAAWMIQGSVTGGSSTLQIRRYNAVSGVWSNFNVSIPGQANGGTTSVPRGAVSPVSGFYYISLPNINNASEQLIYAFNTTTNTFIGQVARIATVANVGNGDLTFDAYGNMYLIASFVPNSYIYRIDRDAIPSSSSTALIPSTLVATIPSSASVLPGLSFDGDGWLYATTIVDVLKINPTTGAIAAGYPIAISGAGGTAFALDLADCNVAPTLRLSKDVTRLASTDQFQLQITPGTAPGNTATTTGATNGVQAARVGHLPVIAGQTYTLTETQQGTAVLNNYAVSLTCQDVANGNAVVPVTAVTTTGASRAYSVVMPGVALGGNTPQVECTYLNTPPPPPDFGTCDARMFMDQVPSNISTLFNVNYGTVPFTLTALGSSTSTTGRNGVGYNVLDNYIYGIRWPTSGGIVELIRVGNNGSGQNMGAIAGLSAGFIWNNGVISPAGDYYVMPGTGGTTLYRVNLATLPYAATPITLSQPVQSFDLAWHNGRLYGVDITSGTSQLVSVDPVNGAVTTIGPTITLTNALAMWGFNNMLLGSSGGSIYSLDPVSGAATLLSVISPSANNGDGANCPSANISFNGDLSVTKTNTPASGPNDLPTDTYTPGETRTYTIVVTNPNTSFGAQNITVSDPVPAGIDVSTVSWTCENTSGGSRCGAASGTGALNDTALDLPSGSVATYRVTMTVPTGFTGNLTNTVTITPPSYLNDSNPANNTATDTDQAVVRLTVTKVSQGGVRAFTFTGNNGWTSQTLTTTLPGVGVTGATQSLASVATATTITESMPSGFVLSGVTCTGMGAGGTVTPGANSFTLNAAAVAAGSDIACTVTNSVQSQPAFPVCPSSMYLSQGPNNTASTTLYNISTLSNPFTFPAIGQGGIVYNSVGFNPLDNYLYGISHVGGIGNRLIRVGADGGTLDLGPVAGLAASNWLSGTFSNTGVMYVLEGGGSANLRAIDVQANTSTLVSLSASVTATDMAWIGGLIYTVQPGGQLRSINPATGQVTNIGSPSGVLDYGAMFGSPTGLFGNANGGGFYSFDLATGARTFISSSPGANVNDGANCPTAPITFAADLSVTKTNTPAQGPNDLAADSYAPGSVRTYSIVVTNQGPFGVQNVSVSDPVPPGVNAATVSWTCASTSGGAVCGAASGSGALSDSGLDLPPNAVATYLVTMTVPTAFTGDLTNTVTVTPPLSTNDSNMANNTATDVDQLAPRITVSKVSQGGIGSFDFTGSNGISAQTLTTTVAGTAVNGTPQYLTTPATSTTVTETAPPAGYVLTSINCTGLPGGTATVNLPARTVTLNAAATAVGADITCTFTNTRTPTVTATKVASASPLLVGQSGQWYTLSITITNGPTTAALAIDDALPTGITLSGVPTLIAGSTTGTLSGCPSSGSSTSGCLVATNVANGTFSIRIPVNVAAAAVGANGGLNTANLSGGGDPLCTIATGQACDPTTPVTPVRLMSADLSIVKSNASTTYTPGSTGFYTLTVRNDGIDNVTGAVVNDTLPAGISLNGAVTCAVSGGGSCGSNTGTAPTITLLLNLDVGAVATITIPVAYASVP